MKKIIIALFFCILLAGCSSVSREEHQKEVTRLSKLNSELREANIKLQGEVSMLKERNRMLKDGTADLFRKIESLTKELKTLKKETSL